MNFDPEPLTVVCNSCGKSADTWDYQHPDAAVECGCCPVAHDHAGLGCRTVTIYAHAHLTLFQMTELLEAEESRDEQPKVPVPAQA